jgi:hypothetical protein
MPERPAFYVAGRGDGGWRDWLALLHPPYTAWHLSYVAIGAASVHPIRLDRLGWALLGFFLGVGVGAHALDELHGRPLRTGIAGWQLTAVGLVAVAGAAVDGWLVGGLRLLPFIGVGALLVLAYNLEWFGGLFHNGVGFAASWGAFPLLTGAYAQHWSISLAALLAAAGAFGLSWVQRTLSTPARWLRRSVHELAATATTVDGEVRQLTTANLLAPLEQALKAMSASLVVLAVALVLAAR